MTNLEIVSKIQECVNNIQLAKDFLENDYDNDDLKLDNEIIKQARLIETYSYMLHS
jgi:hypothetical protein